ncbi:MAG: dTDP-4-dehydrorhamnose 3,5-epimerase [Alphaproteobacteria bacterium]|nr:dTDP-4-dehydrorhamnose 3,5-epimerase [Alphaproteobacteria bacterium]
MKVEQTELADVLIVEPQRFGDERGFFQETWHQDRYTDAGIGATFVQDNFSFSKRGVLRGLHLQHPSAQGKLVWVLQGAVYDVAADLRVGSPSFGRWVGVDLSLENGRQVWIPEGFAHGFCVVSETALLVYKCTDTYAPDNEITVVWNDPTLKIDWPVSNPIVSDKDAAGTRLSELDRNRLPRYTEPK